MYLGGAAVLWKCSTVVRYHCKSIVPLIHLRNVEECSFSLNSRVVAKIFENFDFNLSWMPFRQNKSGSLQVRFEVQYGARMLWREAARSSTFAEVLMSSAWVICCIQKCWWALLGWFVATRSVDELCLSHLLHPEVLYFVQNFPQEIDEVNVVKFRNWLMVYLLCELGD